MTAREHLDRCLRRFVEHAMAGEDEQALAAFGDAQALMVDVRAARDEGRAWVSSERDAAARLPAGVEECGVRAQQLAWADARRAGRL